MPSSTEVVDGLWVKTSTSTNGKMATLKALLDAVGLPCSELVFTLQPKVGG